MCNSGGQEISGTNKQQKIKKIKIEIEMVRESIVTLKKKRTMSTVFISLWAH